ncbi:hypothetical protein JB92DRAFT_2839648, partial [Gautieria morchelliformis]
MHTPCSPCWSNPWSDRMISRRGSVVHSCPVTPLMLASGPPWFPFTFASLDKGFLPCEDLSDPISDPLVFFRLVDTWAVSPSTTHAFLSSLQWFQAVAFPARSHTHGNSFSIQPSQLGSKGPSSSSADLLTPARCASFRRCFSSCAARFSPCPCFWASGSLPVSSDGVLLQTEIPSALASFFFVAARLFSAFSTVAFSPVACSSASFSATSSASHSTHSRSRRSCSSRSLRSLFLCAPLPCTPPPAAPSPSERPLQPCVFPPILFPQAQLV